jgi:RNA polymerase sigma-70 factor (ECF subfamily)
MNPEPLRRLVGAPNAGAFATTHWSVVVTAGCLDSAAAQAAMAQLCERYWYPLYAFLRQQNRSSEDAQDLVQGFFARVLQSPTWLAQVTPERGRFRSWLLASLRHHLADERDRALTLKRGGGATVVPLDALDAESRYQLEPPDPRSPEQLYDRRWALTVLSEALDQLRRDYDQAGKSPVFEILQQTLPGGSGELAYDAIASALGMTEGAVKVAVHRLRQRYREIVRDLVAQTLENPGMVETELGHLMAALSPS